MGIVTRGWGGGMQERKRSKVFISYSHEDKAAADRIREAITIFSDFEVWMDAAHVEPGQSISSAIVQGLKESTYYVLLISESSNKSQWVKREISVAFDIAKNNNIAVIAHAEMQKTFKARIKFAGSTQGLGTFEDKSDVPSKVT
jgi:hypothetical protein